MEFDAFRLAASTADLDEEPAAREHADLVEFRMDLAAAPLDALDAYDGTLPLLCTNRPTWEGGECEASEADRLAALETAAEHPSVEAIDVELAAIAEGAQPTLDHAHDHGAQVVASVHDFERTPAGDDLAQLVARATAAGDIGKVAVTADDRGDVLRLLSVTDAITREGGTAATMAMGEAGRHSRAVAPLYGSCLGYAPVDPANATAPGQYDLATLDRLVTELGGR
ncbi:type I 3-dehydroquinate dehydratase [Halorarius litoreus]|uniref:type I 3-dehydroquinate dehydratase n=1 Tax=Halorarius litoreus TaxID=2962676 RepID=UPI0020CD69DA|nr:type I 3-dehydroquinate dehydratase [Halorarius litoreus]